MVLQLSHSCIGSFVGGGVIASDDLLVVAMER
jgi:hypothetical protein